MNIEQKNEAYLKNYDDILKNNSQSIIFHDYRVGLTMVKPWGEDDHHWTTVYESTNPVAGQESLPPLPLSKSDPS